MRETGISRTGVLDSGSALNTYPEHAINFILVHDSHSVLALDTEPTSPLRKIKCTG